jgi:MFS family permease
VLSVAAETVRGLPRVYWILWIGMLINRLGNFVVPFLALYLTQERGLSVEQAGLIAALYGAGSLAAGPIGGVLADRIGRRATMVVGLLGGAAAMVHLGTARSLGHVMIAAPILGFVGDTYRPAVWAAVSDVVEPQDRLRAFGFLYWAINLGFAISGVVAGVLASRSYWLLFAGDALTSAVMGVVVLTLVPETRPAEARRASTPGSAAADALAPFRDGVFMAFILLAFLLAMMFMQHAVALPLDMRDHGIDASRYGVAIATNGVLIVLLQPFAARLVQTRPRSQVMAAASVLVGLGFGLTAFAQTLPAFVFTVAIWTLGEILLSPVTPTVVADLAPPALRGTYQGVNQMSWGAAYCLAPVIGSAVLAKAGARTLWLSCLALGLVVALGHLAIAGPRRERLASLGVEARD